MAEPAGGGSSPAVPGPGPDDAGRALAPSGPARPSPSAADRSPGLREALLVGELVVVVVLLAGAATYLLPGDLRDVVLRTPLLILVLLVGTAAVLWRIARPTRPDR